MSLYVVHKLCIFCGELSWRTSPQPPSSVTLSPRTSDNPEIVEIFTSVARVHRVNHPCIEFTINITATVQNIHIAP